MDCCGSSKHKENDKESTTDKLSSENSPAQKEHAHAGGGCCGGGSANGMWLHLVVMVIAVIAISYFTKG